MSSTGVSDDVPRKEKQMNMNIRLLAYCMSTTLHSRRPRVVERMYLSPPCTACSKRDSSYDRLSDMCECRASWKMRYWQRLG